MKIQHRSRPSEPWLKEGQFGEVLRITPAYRTIPAQAYCRWDEGTFTWERLTDIIPLETDD